ncbi:MAG: septum site-determining protein Ssd [Nocardioidaceae bacterium]
MTASTALLVTRDEKLLEDMLRLAAAAGVVLDVAHDGHAALRGWASVPVVLVGVDQLRPVAAHVPPRREAVHVVSADPVPDELLRAALAIGAENVVELPAADAWVVELLTDVADGGTSRAVTVAVIGGSGGVGATTFAAALAVSAASAADRALLVDADPLGGGVDRVVGFEDLPGVRWDSLTQTTGRLSARSLRDSLPEQDGLAVLTWGSGGHQPLEPRVVREVVSAAQRGSDCVVVDVPRHPGPATSELLARCDEVLLLTGLTVPAVAATARVAALLEGVARGVHLVARENGSGLDPAEVAHMLGLPLMAVMPSQRRLAESIDLGLGPVHARRGPLATTARDVLRRLGCPAPGGR